MTANTDREPRTADDPYLELLPRVAESGSLPAFTYGGTQRVLVDGLEDIHQVVARGTDEMRVTAVTDAVRQAQGDGLLLSSLPRWRPRRLVIQRQLAPSQLRPKARIIQRNTVALLDRWRDGETFDLKAPLTGLALDNLGDVIFGSDFSGVREVVREAVEAVMDVLEQANTGGASPESTARLQDAVDELDVFIGDLVAVRSGVEDPRGDILDVLVRTAASGDPVFADPWARDEAVTLILAGHDTIAFLAAMCAYLLSTHPEVLARVRTEVDAAFAAGVDAAGLPEAAPLARHVVEETLRLYPPVPVLHRTAPEGFALSGRPIPAGTTLVISPWVTHRQARYFPDPDAFDPDRFAQPRRTDIPKHAYFPFGAGRRICAGNHFSLLQSVIVVAHLAATVDFELLDDHPPSLLAPVGLRFKDAVHVRVTKR